MYWVICTEIIQRTSFSQFYVLFYGPSGVSSTNIPFNITPQGVVVVSQPLVYRNSIHDINIANVTMVFLEGDGDPTTNCNRSETKITVKVIVEKSGNYVFSKLLYPKRKTVFKFDEDKKAHSKRRLFSKTNFRVLFSLLVFLTAWTDISYLNQMYQKLLLRNWPVLCGITFAMVSVHHEFT